MTDAQIRDMLLRLIVKESFATTHSFFGTSDIDPAVLYSTFACFIKYTNEALHLDRTARIDSKDFADDTLAEALDIAMPAFDNAFYSQQASLTPLLSLDKFTYPRLVSDAPLVAKLAYAYNDMLNYIYPKLRYKPFKSFSYESCYIIISEFTNRFSDLIDSIPDIPSAPPVYNAPQRSMPSKPSKSSDNLTGIRISIAVVTAIVILYILLK